MPKKIDSLKTWFERAADFHEIYEAFCLKYNKIAGDDSLQPGLFYKSLQSISTQTIIDLNNIKESPLKYWKSIRAHEPLLTKAASNEFKIKIRPHIIALELHSRYVLDKASSQRGISTGNVVYESVSAAECAEYLSEFSCDR